MPFSICSVWIILSHAARKHSSLEQLTIFLCVFRADELFFIIVTDLISLKHFLNQGAILSLII